MIKIFTCGLCKSKVGTRKALRKHLREKHFKKRKLTNFEDSKGKKQNQHWWRFEEFST
jgi:hypothetical protein